MQNEKFKHVTNHRVIKCRCLGSTNKFPARIALTEERYQVKDRIYLSWTHAKSDNPVEVVKDYFEEIGLNLVAYGWINNDLYFLSDNWADEFITIKGEKL